MNSTKRTINTNYIDGILAPRNYISNGKATAANTQGWSTYADAAGTSPVDGTGGSPNVTISTSATSPLSGDNSFTLVKDAANRQGQGFSYDFTIDSCDQAKVLQISLDYLVSSGTFVAGSGTTDSDVTLWLYDVTNSTVIQPSTYKLYSNSSTISTRFISNFQTASNSTSYRLIMHVGSTSSSAYTLKVDNVSVSSTQYVYGSPITDWSSYTPTFVGLGTPTNVSFFYRRIGSNLEVNGFLTTGTVTATPGSMSLPTGLNINTDTVTRNNLVSAAGSVLGTWNTNQASEEGTIIAAPSTSTTLVYFGSSAASAQSNPMTPNANNFNVLWISSTSGSIRFSVPIQGWSSSVQTSDNADSRTLVEQYTGNAGTSITANTTNIDFATKVTDTHGAWSGTVFTATNAGFYTFQGFCKFTASVSPDLFLYKNSSSILRVTTNAGVSTNSKGFIGSLYLVSGDTVSLRSDTAVTLSNSATDHWISINRSPSSSIISATETVAASYWLSANQTTSVQINYDSKEFDTHGAVTTGVGVWKFTAPISGTYLVTAMCYASTTANYFINKNGSSHKFIAYALSASNALTGTVVVKLIAGDTIDVRPGASVTVQGGSLSGATTNTIAIVRMGN